MTKHRVLVTAVGGNIGQGVLKSLRAAKRDFYITGIDMEGLSAGFSFCDAYYRTSRTGEELFKDELSAIVKKEKIEAIYVCSPTELEYFSSHKEKLENSLGIMVFVNTPAVVRIGSDKFETAMFLQNAGLPYPETVTAQDDKGLERLVKKHGFPLILKPRLGFTSRNVFLVNSKEEITASRALLPDMVVQQYLPDPASEYTAATVSGSDKKVRAVIVLHRDLAQGTTYRTELAEDKNISNQVIQIVETLGSVGPCNLQFRLFKEKVCVFEINPRFSGTSGIRYLYGFNDSEMMFELFKLGVEVRQPKLNSAVVLRYWNEVFIPDATFGELRSGSKKHRGMQAMIQ